MVVGVEREGGNLNHSSHFHKPKLYCPSSNMKVNLSSVRIPLVILTKCTSRSLLGTEMLEAVAAAALGMQLTN